MKPVNSMRDVAIALRVYLFPMVVSFLTMSGAWQVRAQAPEVAPAVDRGAPNPSHRTRMLPSGDLFDALMSAPRNRDDRPVFERLKMTAETAARLVPIATDALRSPKVFWPERPYDPNYSPGNDIAERQSDLMNFLWDLGPRAVASAPTLKALMNSGDVSQRIQVQAAATLVRVTGQSEPGIAFLIKSLQTGDDQSMDELVRLGPPAKAAAPVLIALVESKDKDKETRAHAASALIRITGIAEPGIPFLVALLQAPVTEAALPSVTGKTPRPDRDIALEQLASLGPLAKDAAPAMSALVGSTEVPSSLRIATAITLVLIERKSDPGVTRLCSLLKDPNTDAQGKSDILTGLQKLGPVAVEAAPSIVEIIESELHDNEIRYSGAAALNAMLTAPVLNQLVPKDYLDEAVDLILSFQYDGQADPLIKLQMVYLEKNPDTTTKTTAAEKLANLGAKSSQAVADLLPLLKDPQAGPRIAAASALIRITGQSEPGIKTLVNLLRGETVAVTCAAIDALGEIGPAVAGAIPDLTQLMNATDVDPRVRACAAHALVRIAGQTEPGVSALAELLGEKDAQVETAVIEYLTDLGRKAAGSLPALTQLIQAEETDPKVQLQAAAAIIEMGGSPEAPVNRFIKLLDDTKADSYRRDYASLQGEVTGLQNWLTDMEGATAEKYLSGLAAVGLSDREISSRQTAVTALQQNIADLKAQGVLETDDRMQSLHSRQAELVAALQGAVDQSLNKMKLRYRLENFQLALLGHAVELSKQYYLIQNEAAIQLRDIGPKAAAAIPSLEALCRKPGANISVRIHAASALARIAGKPGVDALIALLNESGWSEGSVTDPDSLRLVAEELEDYATSEWAASDLKSFASSSIPANDKVKAIAAAMLFRTTENSGDAEDDRIDHMLERKHLRLKDEPTSDQWRSASDDDEQTRNDCLKVLEELLHKTDQNEVVVIAAEKLGSLGIHAEGAASTLAEIIRKPDVDPAVRISAATALIRVTRQQTPGLHILLSQLHGPLALESIGQLGNLGPLAMSAVPSLLSARDAAADWETIRAIDVCLSRIRDSSGF